MGIEIEMEMEMETNWIPSGVIYRNFYLFLLLIFFAKIFEIVYDMNEF